MAPPDDGALQPPASSDSLKSAAPLSVTSAHLGSWSSGGAQVKTEPPDPSTAEEDIIRAAEEAIREAEQITAAQQMAADEDRMQISSQHEGLKMKIIIPKEEEGDPFCFSNTSSELEPTSSPTANQRMRIDRRYQRKPRTPRSPTRGTLSRQQTHGTKSATQGRYYTNEYKRTVLVYANTHGNRPAARHFGISESTVRGWRNRFGWLLDPSASGPPIKIQPVDGDVQNADIDSVSGDYDYMDSTVTSPESYTTSSVPVDPEVAHTLDSGEFSTISGADLGLVSQSSMTSDGRVERGSERRFVREPGDDDDEPGGEEVDIMQKAMAESDLIFDATDLI